MDICEEMGERGSFLKKFETFEEYDIFHENAKKSKAIEAYCEHGGRFIFWLPYRQVWKSHTQKILSTDIPQKRW